jgi:phosphatidylserine decarboxylase
LFGFTLFFFRDPVRKLPEEIKDNHIISPADGKVMMIEEIGNEPVFLKSPAKLIAIFLSPLNVHVNRIPVSGVIDYYEYIKGDYIVAFDHKSSERNERTIVGITNEKFKVLFKQIAGFVARRIICNTMKGSNVKAGEKFGMIRFGSRMDVIIPEHSNVLVSVNQKVTAGETILAEVLI